MKAPAVSVVAAPGASTPPLLLTTLELTIASAGLVTMYGSAGFGLVDLITTVEALGAETLTPLSSTDGAPARLMTRLNENTTSAAVSGVPSENMTAWRRLNVNVLASSDDVNEAATAGAGRIGIMPTGVTELEDHELGIVGLATMGMNLARNFASHGIRVGVYNRTRHRTDEFMAAHGGEADFHPAVTLEELVHVLAPPRAILLMVKAGAAVDEGIEALSMLLEPGDIIIDGGNSLFHDTRRRAAAAARAGLGFLGMGVSGGEEGALRGPSLMPGGTRASYEHVEEMLKAIAANVNGVPCCTYIGPDGAGHFVKMVHNGIEYADIQLIAESYDLLRSAVGLSPSELATIFREWNEGRLQSYLIEITANVLAKNSDGTDA